MYKIQTFYHSSAGLQAIIEQAGIRKSINYLYICIQIKHKKFKDKFHYGSKNNYITVAYKLYVADEESGVEDVIEEATTEHPFQFISNMGTALDSLRR